MNYAFWSWVGLVALVVFGWWQVRSWAKARRGNLPMVTPPEARLFIPGSNPPRMETNEEYDRRLPDEHSRYQRELDARAAAEDTVKSSTRLAYGGLILVGAFLTLLILAAGGGIHSEDIESMVGKSVAKAVEKGTKDIVTALTEVNGSVSNLIVRMGGLESRVSKLETDGVTLHRDGPAPMKMEIGGVEVTNLDGLAAELAKSRDAAIAVAITNNNRKLREELIPAVKAEVASGIAGITNSLGEHERTLSELLAASRNAAASKAPTATNSYSALTRNHWPNKVKKVTVVVVAEYVAPMDKATAELGLSMVAQKIHEDVGDEFYITPATPENQARFRARAKPVVERWVATTQAFQQGFKVVGATFSNETAAGAPSAVGWDR